MPHGQIIPRGPNCRGAAGSADGHNFSWAIARRHLRRSPRVRDRVTGARSASNSSCGGRASILRPGRLLSPGLGKGFRLRFAPDHVANVSQHFEPTATPISGR